MKIKTIRSGSKGNCTLIYSKNTKILVDAGIAYLTIKKALEEENISITNLNGILITHNHNDHIKGLTTLIKKTNLKVYIPKEMILELKDYIPIENMKIIPEEFDINDLHINLIYTSHDVNCSVGYIISDGISSMFYATDTGYINRRYYKKMKNQDLYFIESNHDEEMLMNGPYPYYLKQRVISDEGHLSNKTTAEYLKKTIGENTKYIILAHLSEVNNNEKLARMALKEELATKDLNRIKILVAKQDESLPTVEV